MLRARVERCGIQLVLAPLSVKRASLAVPRVQTQAP